MRGKLVITGLVASLLSGVVGVGAAGASDADVSFTVQEGQLTLSQADTGPVALSPGSGGLIAGNAATVTGRLPSVTVVDNRGGITTKSWTVNVSWSDFTDAASGASVPGTAGRAYIAAADELTDLAGSLLDITSGTKATTQAGELAPVVFDGAAYSGAILEGGTLGSGTLSFTPSFAVDVPADAAPGSYSGTVTFTIVP